MRRRVWARLHCALRKHVSQVVRHSRLLPRRRRAAPLSAFDPAFGPADSAVLASRGCAVLPSSSAAAAAHAATPGTFALLFMPHCEAELYDAVLEANWSAAALRWVAVLGNSFSGYADRWASADPAQPQRASRRRPERVLAVGGRCAEHRVDPGGFGVASAFNDMSLHFFGGLAEGDLLLRPAA